MQLPLHVNQWVKVTATNLSGRITAINGANYSLSYRDGTTSTNVLADFSRFFDKC